MKHFLTSLLFCFFAFQMCRAQDTTIVLHSGMYDKTLQEIYINKLDGWLFKKGNDTVWAKNDIDLSGWKKFKPVELSAEQADKNGKFEGWFRIKIKPDTSFGDKPLGINLSSWAACDVYINGELKASNGNTGQNGTPFREPGSLHHSTYPANLVPGNEYTIAVYVVDYLSPFPPRHLKSADGDNNDLISIAGPDFNSTLIPVIIKWTNYPAAWISVCSILSLLFWLLAFQNRNEKNLRLIALCTSFFALNLLCITIHNSAQSITYFSAALYSYSASLFFILYTLLMPLILAKIFKRKVTGLLKIFLAAYFIISMAGLFLPGAVWVIAPLFALITVCIYYIISSRKRLKGPPWAIAAGLLISLVWALLFFFMFAKYQSFTFPYAPLFISGVYLSFPLSLMVYVAMRFKEIIQEVQQHAKQVVQLSEEKREQALNQQKILQEEVNRQTAEIRISLENLKSAHAQLWMLPSLEELGFDRASWGLPPVHGAPNVVVYQNPMYSWLDSSLVLSNEDWPADQTPKFLAYFTGPYVLHKPLPPFSNHHYQSLENERLRIAFEQWLMDNAGWFWPGGTTYLYPQGLNFQLLADVSKSTDGNTRFVNQFFRANVRPTDHYTLSVPNSAKYRLKADNSGFQNMYLCGDWIDFGGNVGYIDGTIQSGQQAAQALRTNFGLGDHKEIWSSINS